MNDKFITSQREEIGDSIGLITNYAARASQRGSTPYIDKT